jgi:glyoxylase-like metal-dependent hydrolase (beta-lactamase superfamily II)
MPLPFALEHINLWLLEDGASWTIVDCGYGTAETRSHWDRLFATTLAGRPVGRILVTHFHPDHFGLAEWLAARTGAPVHITVAEFESAHAWFGGLPGYSREAFFELYREHGLVPVDDMSAFLRGNLYRQGVRSVPERCTRLADGERLAIGGREWRVVTGHGHSPDHAALMCEELDVLISGDMVLPRISTNVSVQPTHPDADPLREFLESLARYAALDRDTLTLPSHGLPFRGLAARAAELRIHHEARLDELRRACGEPRHAAELMPLLFSRQLDMHQTFFAMGETLAHLQYLVHAGEARTFRAGERSFFVAQTAH